MLRSRISRWLGFLFVAAILIGCACPLMWSTLTEPSWTWAMIRSWLGTRPVFYSNQPLTNPKRVIDIRQPATIVLEGGSEYELYGIRLVVPIDPRRLHYGEKGPLEVEIKTPGSSHTKVDYRIRALYCCGNQLMPSYPAKRLPRYFSDDLGTLLVRTGVALPTLKTLREDPEYGRHLLGHVDMLVRDGQGARYRELAVPRNELEALGRLLVTEYPEHWRTGMALLQFCEVSDVQALTEERLRHFLAPAANRRVQPAAA